MALIVKDWNRLLIVAGAVDANYFADWFIRL
jgi:hypothetical protein